MERPSISPSIVWKIRAQAEPTSLPSPPQEPQNEGMPKNGRVNVRIRRGRLR